MAGAKVTVGRATRAPATLVAVLVVLAHGAPVGMSRAGAWMDLRSSPGPDSAAARLVESAYDSWTAPWIQLSGPSMILAPASHVTLMVLACDSAAIQRDRILDHLSPAECNHLMAAVRADQDTALIFRLDLRVFDFPGAMAVAHLGTGVSLRLEDDRGHQWEPTEVIRGPVVTVAGGGKLRRIYYNPPWLRGTERAFGAQYGLSDGHALTVAEHRLRFARRDRVTRELLLDRDTRWIRLRLTYASYEWAATWTLHARPGGIE